nr:integrase, catalytic region, zinc finger, CCHC-type, peptidase aspartic, catalytic [Tanacetum cinerariifolium]
MSTQQDIYTAGSKSRHHMLNKENYVPWSSRLLRYAKSRPNGKLIHNSILNGSYVRKMIPEPGDANRDITTILLGLPKDIYAAVDSCKTAQEIWLRVQQMMKGSDIEIQEKKAKLFNECESHSGVDMLPLFIRPRICIQLITLNSPHQDQSSFNQNYLQQPIPNPEDIIDPTTAMNMAPALMAKAFKLNYSTPTNNNQRISSNPKNRKIAQPGMNMGQDRQMQMVGGNGGNQFRQYAGQNAGNPNQIGNGILVAARAEGNAAGQNRNQIRCYNCRGVADLDEIEEVNANCILMANLQQASTSGTQTDSTLVYDTDGSAEVIQICLWCVDSSCSKHMTGNLKLLINFVWKFMRTVRFGNDHVAAILGFGDLQWGNILIIRVYFVEGLGHNLFSVGQFCDSDLEVAFRRNACFVRNLE